MGRDDRSVDRAGGHGDSIAVVIPAYNAGSHLGQALRSVLAQTRPAEEVIVVDDGSTDDTGDVVGDFGADVQYVRQANSGVSAARNRGIETATTDYISFLDSDDLFAPEKLERQASLFGPGTVAVSSGAVLVDDSLRPSAVRRPSLPDDLLVNLFTEGNLIGSPSSVVASRAVLREIGGFDGRLSFTADWDLWIRLARVGRLRCVPEPLIAYRIHDASMSTDAGLIEVDSIAMLERALAEPGNPPEVASAAGEVLARQWSVAAGCHLKAGDRAAAARCLVRGAVASPSRQAKALARAVRNRSGSRRHEAGARLRGSPHVSVDAPAGESGEIDWLREYEQVAC